MQGFDCTWTTDFGDWTREYHVDWLRRRFNVSERLLTMISSRRAGVQAVQILKRIVLHTVRDCSVDIMISLAEMSSTGLDVEIKHS